MIPVTSFASEKIAVFGLGRSGLSAALALAAGGANVVAWDDVVAQREVAVAQGICLANFTSAGFSGVRYLVLSPGIPLTHPVPHPVVTMARSSGVKILGDVELLARSVAAARLVGITGTNGKSTATSLLGCLMRTAGEEIQIGANLGQPALSLEPLGSSGTYVLELSSYQLDLIETTVFNVAVWLNLSADHLDRHGGIKGYIDAKKNIFKRQNETCVAVVGIDDPVSLDLANQLTALGVQRVVPISGRRSVAGGVYVIEGQLFDNIEGKRVAAADLRTVQALPGQHNWQNAAAAFAAARACGLSRVSAVSGLENYSGLPHRQEEVAVIDGIRYINDSKATNISAATHALACHSSIYWIAGGRAKDLSLDSLGEVLPRVAHVFLIGEAAKYFAEKLQGLVAVTVSGTLDIAVAQARDAALDRGDEAGVVLFSPACASFDQFKNFEERGDTFRSLVQGFETMKTGLSDTNNTTQHKRPSE